MSKKTLIFIIAFTLILIAAVVWWLTRAPAPSTTVPPISTGESTVTTGQTTLPAPPLTPQQVAVTNLKNSALRFVEMYGSYSTDVRYVNFEAVKNLVTDNMRRNMETAKADVPSEGFYSVTTKALIAKVESESESAASVIISTQRLESFSREGQSQVRYQDIKLNLVRTSGAWLVDSATWQ